MNIFAKLSIILHVLRWRIRWTRHNLDYIPRGLNPQLFISGRQAAAIMPDHATVASCGIAGNSRCSIFFFGIKDRFLKTGHPKGLTWLANSAQGGRGKLPATLEELGLPGLITRHISGHPETHKSLLRLADQGLLDLHNIPQGVFAKLYEAQSRGESTLRARAGLGTFIDPRVGRGSSVTGDSPVSFVKVAGDQLEFSLPKPEYCFFTLPYADAEGNLYARHAACYNECQEAAAATRANGGRVIACVSRVIPKSPTEIFMPASAIDHIVVHPWSEQAGTILQRRPWYLLTEGAKVKHAKAVARAKFLNNLLRVTPRRTALEEALARLAATQFTRMARRGNLVNIGVGLPEEVARVLVEESVADDITFMTEAGAIGGLPAPGLFFGAAISPKRLVGAAEAFHILEEKLDITVLGMVEADEQGNVNVSRRGPKASQFVGTGGFCDITTAARKILFVGSWMSGGSIQLTDRGLRLAKAGIPKFTARVSEITFCGQEALRQGKEVYFATCVGLFQLTPDGMTLIELMPGISLDELKRTSPMIIRTTSDNPPTISDTSILRGAQFRLARLSTG